MAKIKANQSRFSGAPWFPTEEVDIIVGGAGGIGSWVCLLLARAGFMPHVYDNDLFEEHNMAGQFCKSADITSPKVEAIKHSIIDYAQVVINTNQELYTPESPTHNFVMAGFDNILSRRIMFNNWRTKYGQDPNSIFIDGRLSAEQLQIFCVIGGNSENIERYEREYLFDDADVEEPVCTFKQTSHAASMIASHMVAFFTNHYTNVVLGSQTRIVPFYWEYLIPLDMILSDN